MHSSANPWFVRKPNGGMRPRSLPQSATLLSAYLYRDITYATLISCIICPHSCPYTRSSMIFVTPFEIAERDDPDGARRLTITGELDLASGSKLQERLSALHAGRRTVRLDLSELEFIDSTGIAIIARGLTHSARDGWKLEVDPNVPRQIARLITIAGIADKLWGQRGEAGNARPVPPQAATSGSTPRTRDKVYLGPVGRPESQGTAPPLP